MATARSRDAVVGVVVGRNLGFFNKRGYFDLDAISPVEYRTGVLENGKRKAMRIWLKSSVLFESGPDGSEVVTPDGRARIDSAMSTYLKYLPANPLVVEGYAPAATVAARCRWSGNTCVFRAL